MIVVCGPWPNLSTKNMLTGISSVSSFISTDLGSSYVATPTPVLDTVNRQITITFTTTSIVTGGRTLMFIIVGVASPPTQTTTITSGFSVATGDANGAKIDETNSITVSPTCVFTLTTGTFANPSMQVNSLYLSPQIEFSETPTITI